MTKTNKRDRKWGKDIEKEPPKKRNTKQDIDSKPVIEMYKILVDNSGFSKAMPYDECMKMIGEMEASAKKLRRPLPSLMLVKQ